MKASYFPVTTVTIDRQGCHNILLDVEKLKRIVLKVADSFLKEVNDNV